jgi:hypothetical protein
LRLQFFNLLNSLSKAASSSLVIFELSGDLDKDGSDDEDDEDDVVEELPPMLLLLNIFYFKSNII